MDVYQKPYSSTSHINDFNKVFVYVGDVSCTAWGSKENRLATWAKSTRRYKLCVLKLPFQCIINMFLNALHSLTSYSIFIIDWLVSSVFVSECQIRSWLFCQHWPTMFPVSCKQASEKQWPPSVCSQGQLIYHMNSYYMFIIICLVVMVMVSLSQVYTLMGRRLRELCSTLDISDELRLKIWTCFEHSLVNCTHLMVDRHLDQLLMCAIYIIAKVGFDVSERSLSI